MNRRGNEDKLGGMGEECVRFFSVNSIILRQLGRHFCRLFDCLPKTLEIGLSIGSVMPNDGMHFRMAEI